MATAGGEPDTVGRASGVAGPSLAPRGHRSWTPLARALVATGDRWTLMIVLQLASGRMRLSTLQGRLPGVSTGVLERYVQQMVTLGLVTRMRFKEMPPRVELELTSAGEDLLPVARALARWGMRHMWSPPGERERVDVACLLRMLPVLLEESAWAFPDGCVEAVATHPSPRVSHRYQTKDGQMLSTCSPDEKATARVEGTHPAWIAALGPHGNFARLHLSGDTGLAKSVLDALHHC